jgi:molybdopterin synthase catalytic subunit
LPNFPASLAEGDEVAFLPPVSGGSADGDAELRPDGHYFALTRHAIDTRAVIARLLTGAEGAVVTFEGTVRNHTKGRATRCLDYECYQSMALKTMLKIGLEIAAQYEVGRIAMVHRLGRLLIGETSVAIIVTAPASRAGLRRCAGSHRPAQEAGPHLEEGTFRGWRGLGGRRVGRQCSRGWMNAKRPRPDSIAAALAAVCGGRCWRSRRRSSGTDVNMVHVIASVKNSKGELVGACKNRISNYPGQRRSAGDPGVRAADLAAFIHRFIDRRQRLHGKGLEVRDGFRHQIPAGPALGRQSRRMR